MSGLGVDLWYSTSEVWGSVLSEGLGLGFVVTLVATF